MLDPEIESTKAFETGNKTIINKERYWNNLGRLHRTPYTGFKWMITKDNSGNESDKSIFSEHKPFHDYELGRAYFSSFWFRKKQFRVGDFIMSFRGNGKHEYFRIVGAFQALKSFLGAWNKKGKVEDEIQKRGHPYVLLVPLTCVEESLAIITKNDFSPRENPVRRSDQTRYKTFSNEIVLDRRHASYVDENNIFMIPVWLGEEEFFIKKIDVEIKNNPTVYLQKPVETNENKFVVMHCVSEGRIQQDYIKKNNNRTVKKTTFFSPLSAEQASLLTCTPDVLIQKHVSKHWNQDLNAKQIQFTKRLRYFEADENVTDVPYFFGEGSSDESGSEGSFSVEEDESNDSYDSTGSDFFSNDEFISCVPDYAKNIKFEDCLPQLVVQKSIDGSSHFTNGLKELLLGYFEIPSKFEVESIKDPSKLSLLHRNMINANDLTRSSNGFPWMSIAEQYLCYSISLMRNIVCLNPYGNRGFLCSVVAALTEFGVTVIVESSPKKIKIEINELKKFDSDYLVSKLLDITAVKGENARPEQPLAFIVNQIIANRLKGPKLIFVTIDNMNDKRIMKHLLKIFELRMMKRIIFMGIEVQKVVNLPDEIQNVPYTLITEQIKPLHLGKVLKRQTKTCSMEKPILFPFYERCVGFFVERKLHIQQVATRIHQILQCFTENVKQVGLNFSPLEEIPKCVCFCVNGTECKKMKAFFEKKFHQFVAVIEESQASQTINTIIRKFQVGKIRIIFLTKAYDMLKSIPDIRFIFHVSCGASFSKYVEETQCAGNDGKPTFCILFFRAKESNVFEKKTNTYSDQEQSVTKIESQAMFNYGMSGDVNICRRVMIGTEFYAHDHRLYHDSIREQKFCCDHCRLKLGLEGSLFPGKQSKGSFKSKGAPYKVCLSKEMTISWMIEIIFKKMKEEDRDHYDLNEIRKLYCERSFDITSRPSRAIFDKIDLKTFFILVRAYKVRYSLLDDIGFVMKMSHTLDTQQSKHTIINQNQIENILTSLNREAFVLKLRNIPQKIEEKTLSGQVNNFSSEDILDSCKGMKEQLCRSKSQKNPSLHELLNAQRNFQTRLRYMINGSGMPLMKFLAIDEMWWLTYLPFIVYFEKCRRDNDQSECKFNEQIMQKLLDRTWDWRDCKKVYDFLGNLTNSIEKSKLKNPSFSDFRFSADFGKNGQARLTLHPPSLSTCSTRIDRKFGKHRFLYIYMPISQRRHAYDLVVGFTGKSLWICQRKYSFLWVDKYSKPQVYIFFAETGLGIAEEEELTVKDVREWCFPNALNTELTQSCLYACMRANFSVSVPSFKLPKACLEVIQDIAKNSEKTVAGECGLISRNLLDAIWVHYQNSQGQRNGGEIVQDEISETSSCPFRFFQGQIGGFVGIWILDSNLGDCLKIVCRKSQQKYRVAMRSNFNFNDRKSNDSCERKFVFDELFDTVDVISWDLSKNLDTLNPRMIQLLEYRGVSFTTMSPYLKISECLPCKIQVSNSRFLHLVPDHTKTLNEGEAFLASNDQVGSTIIAIQQKVHFVGDLYKFRLQSLSQLHERSIRIRNTKESNHFTMFENVSDKFLIVSSKGQNSEASKMLPGIVWVCWERNIVNAVDDNHMIESTLPELKSKNKPVKSYSFSKPEIFQDAWRFRNYDNDLKLLNAMMDILIDMYGFDNDMTKAIGRQLYLQAKEPNHLCKAPKKIEDTLEKALKEKGFPHWMAPRDDTKAKTFKSKNAMGEIWDKFNLDRVKVLWQY